MSNCLNCIHRCVCGIKFKDITNPCPHYKDESMMIESPCPIGTTIFLRHLLKDGSFFVNTATVVGLHLRDTESRRKLKREEYLVVRGGYGFSKHIPFSHIGKYAFFTHKEKEAEQGCFDPKEG